MRVTKVKRPLLQIFQLLLQGGPLAKAVAKDRVDESRLRFETEVARKLDGFMHGGVVWNPIKPEELVEREPEKDLQRRFLGTLIGLARDEPVKGGPPSDHAERQLLHETAIRRSQSPLA
jgi:hypothetical protein